jgi:hypothetical protein
MTLRRFRASDSSSYNRKRAVSGELLLAKAQPLSDGPAFLAGADAPAARFAFTLVWQAA